MSNLAGSARVVLTGILFAMIGFSYAVATSSSVEQQPGISSRAVVAGSGNLHFTNPVTTTDTTGDRTLGNVMLGVAFARTAYLTGGVAPYKFYSTGATGIGTYSQHPGLPGFLNATDFLMLGTNTGLVTGLVTVTTLKVIEFDITGSDAAGSHVTSPFRLTLLPAGAVQIANPNLPDGVQYVPYSTGIEAMGGVAPYTFSATGIPKGLELSTSGSLTGIPLVSGPATLTVTATDSKGATTGPTSVTLNIEAPVSTAIGNTGAVTTGLTVKTTSKSDSISYKGLVNLNLNPLVPATGNPLSALTGAVIELNVGGYGIDALPLNSTGSSAKTAKGAVAVSAKLTSTGALTFTVKGATSGQIAGLLGIGSLTATGNQDLVVKVTITTSTGVTVIASTEVLNVTTGKSAATYKFGVGNELGGIFFLTGVSGKADSTGAGAVYKTSFLAFAPTAAPITAVTTASVTVGTPAAALSGGGNTTTPAATATFSSGVVKVKGAKGAQLSAFSLSLSKTGKGTATTGDLTNASTGLPSLTKATAATTSPFSFGFDLANAGAPALHAQDQTLIFSKSTSWSSKNPNK